MCDKKTVVFIENGQKPLLLPPSTLKKKSSLGTLLPPRGAHFNSYLYTYKGF